MIFGYLFSLCNMAAYLVAAVTGVFACRYLWHKTKAVKAKKAKTITLGDPRILRGTNSAGIVIDEGKAPDVSKWDIDD